jgi:hypothetical protein
MRKHNQAALKQRSWCHAAFSNLLDSVDRAEDTRRELQLLSSRISSSSGERRLSRTRHPAVRGFAMPKAELAGFFNGE